MRNLFFDILARLRVAGWRLRAIAARVWPMIASVRIFIPIAVIAVLLASYTWWWQQIADGVRNAAAQFQIDQHARRREALWDDLVISGFPYRVEARFEAPHITAPDRGAAWDGKAVVLSILPLRPRHIALAFEGHQHFLYTKDHLIEGGADAQKAAVNIVAGSDSTEQISLDVEGLSGQGDFDARHVEIVVPSATASAEVSAEAGDRTIAPIALTAALNNVALRGDVTLPLGPVIKLIDLKAQLQFPVTEDDGPNASFVSAWRQTNTPLEIESFDLDWGGVTVAAHGELKLDAQARPEGRLALKIGNHRRLLEVLIAEGWISPEARRGVEAALNTLAFMSGDPERRIDVAVRFAGGSAYLELFGLLPIRLGPVAPLIPPPAPLPNFQP